MQSKRRRIGRSRGSAVAPLIITLGLMLWAAPASAVHDEGVFALDGDVTTGSCLGGNGTNTSAFGGTSGCNGEDWDALYDCTGSGLGSCTSEVACDANGDGVISATECTQNHANAIALMAVDPAPLSIFTGGGSKDEKDLTAWSWVNGSVPDKDDLIEAFAALYVDPPGTMRNGQSVAGHRVVYFGANRLAVNGDAQIGFWLLQNPVINSGTGDHASPFTNANAGGPVSHKMGDVLILSNFVQGGGSANIQVYVVNKITKGNCPSGSVESKAGVGDICLTQVINGNAGANGVCNLATTGANAVPADAACAATNGALVPAVDPAFTAKSGAPPAMYPIVGFFEGGLDLTAVGLGGECFPTAVMETRSSQSITAVLKDFTLSQFQHCEAQIRTEIKDADGNDVTQPHASVLPGTVIHDEAYVTGVQGGPDPGQGGDGACNASRPCTVSFKFFSNAACSGTPATTENKPCVSDGDGSGSCTATSTSFTTTAPPGYSYLATYNGDSNYPPITLPSTSCEIVEVGKLDSTVSTDIFKVTTTSPLVLGDAITDNHIDLAGQASANVVDQATVAAASGSCGSTGQPPCPTGTVQFTQFANGNCSGTGSTQTSNLNSSTGTALSSVFQLGANGLSYRAIYSGDSIYNASVDSRCEPVCAIDTQQ